MDKSTKSKWQVRAAAAVIFILGFTAGALAFNTYQRWSGARANGDRFEQMLDRLQLNADQKTQVHQTAENAQPRTPRWSKRER